MKKLLVILSSVVAVIALSSIVVYGSSWMNWNGDVQIQQSSNDVAEILTILEQVNEEKLAAEKYADEVENMGSPGLAKQNRELREENSQLKNENSRLTTELSAKDKRIIELEEQVKGLKSNQSSNNQVATMSLSNSEADSEDKSYIEKINSLTGANAALEETVTNLNDDIDQKDKEISTLTESNNSLQSSVDTLNEKVEGLEAVVLAHSTTITERDTSIENLNARITSLEAELEAERSSNSGNVNYINQLEQQLEATNQKIGSLNTSE